MSRQRLQSGDRRQVTAAVLDHIETRQLEAGGQLGVVGGRCHEGIVAAGPLATEGNSPDFPVATGSNSDCYGLSDDELATLVTEALDRAGITTKAALLTMFGTEKAAPQWSRQVRGVEGHHLSMQRLAKLPPQFWREVGTMLTARFGDGVEAAVSRLLVACGDVVGRMKMAPGRVSADYDRRRA